MPVDLKQLVLTHATPKWFQVLWENLLQYLESQRVVQGLDITVTDADGRGKRIDSLGGGGLLGSSEAFPFQLMDVSEGNNLKIRVRRGTVNSVTPNGMSIGDSPEYVLDIDSGTAMIWIVAYWDFESATVDSCEISVRDTFPTNTPGTYWKQLGGYNFTSDGRFLDNVTISSLELQLCGGSVPLWGAS